MTIVIILIALILAVAGYVTYRIGDVKPTEVKKVAEKVAEKLEPAVKKFDEVVEESKKPASENKVAVKTVKKAKTKK